MRGGCSSATADEQMPKGTKKTVKFARKQLCCGNYEHVPQPERHPDPHLISNCDNCMYVHICTFIRFFGVYAPLFEYLCNKEQQLVQCRENISDLRRLTAKKTLGFLVIVTTHIPRLFQINSKVLPTK
jgi:hypothetical protein